MLSVNTGWRYLNIIFGGHRHVNKTSYIGNNFISSSWHEVELRKEKHRGTSWIKPGYRWYIESKIRCIMKQYEAKKGWGADRARWNSALSSKIALGAAHFALYLASTVWLLVHCSVAQSVVQSCTWQHLGHHFVLFRASHHRPSVERKVKDLHPLTTSGPPSLWKKCHKIT